MIFLPEVMQKQDRVIVFTKSQIFMLNTGYLSEAAQRTTTVFISSSTPSGESSHTPHVSVARFQLSQSSVFMAFSLIIA